MSITQRPADHAIRGHLVWVDDDPNLAGAGALKQVEDGIVIVRDGLIVAVGTASALLSMIPEGVPISDHRPHLILPGLIDAHIHLPQTQVVASYGAQLLDWLNRYTFPEELRFADPDHATRQVRFFLDELLRNGTPKRIAAGCG